MRFTARPARFVLALFSFVAIAELDLYTAHADPVPGRKVHVILIGLSQDPKLSQGILSSRLKLRQTLSDCFDIGDFGSFTEIGFPATPQPARLPAINSVPYFTVAYVNDTLSKLTFNEQDAVFCYVMTHGGYTSQVLTAEREYGQWFETQLSRVSGRFEYYSRVDLFELLLDRRVNRTNNNGLTVLFSDACNVQADVPVIKQHPAAAAAATNTVLRNLLLGYKGQVSISASTTGQFSFYFPSGGLFTDNFCDAATLPFASNVPEQKVTNWTDFMARLTEFTDEDFRGRIGSYQGQRTLTPMWMRPASFVTEYKP